MAMNGQLLRLTGLWKRTSAAGNEYFSGRLGAARLVILPNRDAGTEGEPSHILYLAEIGEKPTSSASSGPEARPTQRRHRNAYEHLKPIASRPGPETGGRPFDDPIGDL